MDWNYCGWLGELRGVYYGCGDEEDYCVACGNRVALSMLGLIVALKSTLVRSI